MWREANRENRGGGLCREEDGDVFGRGRNITGKGQGDLHEAVGGTDHPARLDEAATAYKGDRASPVPLVNGCKPGLVLNGGEISTNDLKAGIRCGLLATLELLLFTGRRGPVF